MRWAISGPHWSPAFFSTTHRLPDTRSLHYDTFAQLFTHQTQYDRAGEGQFVGATDDENISPTTKLHFDEFFYRDASVMTMVTTSDQSPEFNSALALLLLANDQASINQFNAQLLALLGTAMVQRVQRPSDDLFGNRQQQQQQGTATANVPAPPPTTISRIASRWVWVIDSMTSGSALLDNPANRRTGHSCAATWQPMKNLYLSGIVGVVISHTQGHSEQRSIRAAWGWLNTSLSTGR